MAEATPSNPAVLRQQLRQAVFDCRERGLTEAATWAAQQLNGLPKQEEGGPSTSLRSHADSDESDAFVYAKALFDGKEYQRCAHVLKRNDCTDSKSKFLELYALYLAGERRKREEMVELAGALGKADVSNRMLDSLERELEALFEAGDADAFILYVYGLVLADRKKLDSARLALRESVTAYPFNWSAWKALQVVCTEWEDVTALNLPDSVCRDFFYVVMCMTLHWNQEALSRMAQLTAVFPRSSFLVLKAGTAHYNLRKMEEAKDLFEDLIARDEFQLEGMQVYSHILYIREDFAALSHLAHKAVLVDKFRDETCCMIGNYYSLKRQHHKAIVYFQRALKLNPACLDAWCLIGHEFLEMKNHHCAIEAYRHAVDTDPRDVRSWYSLGQAYEMMQMPYYALFYYRKAAQLTPDDARMWVAIGNCYEHEHLKCYDAAAKCYRRAVTSGDHENIVLHQLATLYERMDQPDAAYSCFKQNLERMDQQGASGQDVVDALFFMADYCLSKEPPRLGDAEMYAMRLQDFGGPAKDKGRRVIDRVQQRRLEMGGPQLGGQPGGA